MEKENIEKCFAYIPTEERRHHRFNCKALSENCPGFEICSFYKSAEQNAADQNAADVLLCSLNEDRQNEIALKYHDGRMPWKKGEIEG